MFSMQIFDFTSPTPTIITHHFWRYWAITIPMTLTVLGVYWLWIGVKNGKEKKESESLRQERTLVVQSMYEANLALNTPFYPGKGLPGHIL
jgi:hypothetical protein